MERDPIVIGINGEADKLSEEDEEESESGDGDCIRVILEVDWDSEEEILLTDCEMEEVEERVIVTLEISGAGVLFLPWL